MAPEELLGLSWSIGAEIVRMKCKEKLNIVNTKIFPSFIYRLNVALWQYKCQSYIDYFSVINEKLCFKHIKV